MDNTVRILYITRQNISSSSTTSTLEVFNLRKGLTSPPLFILQLTGYMIDDDAEHFLWRQGTQEDCFTRHEGQTHLTVTACE